DGSLETIARTGDPSPLGGTLVDMHSWPSVKSRRCGFGASLTGAPGITGAFVESLKRPAEVTGLTIGAPDPGTGSSAMTWDPQQVPGDGSVVHDVLRGKLSGLGVDAECAVDDFQGPVWQEPAAACQVDPGEGCWYLARAEDTCGRGPYEQGGTRCLDP